MGQSTGFFPTFSHGRKTQNAGTAIVVLIPPKRKRKTKLTKFSVTVGATAHLLTVLRTKGTTFVNGTAAAGQKVVNLLADPGLFPTNFQVAQEPTAAGDYLVFETPDGRYYADTVASVATGPGGVGIAVTMTNNLPTGGLAGPTANNSNNPGAKCWRMGQVSNLDPNGVLQELDPTFTLTAGGATTQVADDGSLAESYNRYEPLLLYNPNNANQDTLEFCSGVYAPA